MEFDDTIDEMNVRRNRARSGLQPAEERGIPFVIRRLHGYNECRPLLRCSPIAH
jgi:hypothetical protein